MPNTEDGCGGVLQSGNCVGSYGTRQGERVFVIHTFHRHQVVEFLAKLRYASRRKAVVLCVVCYHTRTVLGEVLRRETVAAIALQYSPPVVSLWHRTQKSSRVAVY